MLIGYEDIKLVPGEFPFAAASSEKNRPENLFFMATTKRIVLAVRWSAKYLFAPNSPMFRKSFDEGGKQISR